jgi:hypothetical protein
MQPRRTPPEKEGRRWDESFQDIKRLREDARDLSNQYAALAVQLAEMVLLIQKLQENAGTPRRDGEQTPSMADKKRADGVLQQRRPHEDDVALLEPELSANLWHLKETAAKVSKHCIRYPAIHGISYIPVGLAAKAY